MEYGAVIWDPNLAKDVNSLERIQRQAARFIQNDYRSKDPGCVTHMLKVLNLPLLRNRRMNKRLTFMFKIINGLVPAIEPQKYFVELKNTRLVTGNRLPEYNYQHTVKRNIRNNSICYKVKNTNSDKFENSYFIRTVAEWNTLSEEVVRSKSVDQFSANLAKFKHFY